MSSKQQEHGPILPWIALAIALPCCTPAPQPALEAVPRSSVAAPQPAPVPAPSASTPQPGAAESPVEARCASIRAHNVALLAAGSPSDQDPFSTPCLPTPGGAWALRIDAWKKGSSEELKGEWTLVHIDRAGVEAVARPGDASIYALMGGVGFGATGIEPRLFDFDGDGEPEILLVTHHSVHEGPSTSAATVATFKGGAVRELPGVPAHPEGFADVDKDGRPDILYYPYGADVTDPCSAFDHHEEGPSFVAHARPDGTFSVDDAVARAHLSAQCPAAGAAPAPSGSEPARPELCALFRGATEQQAAAVLAKACRPLRKGEDACHPGPGGCYDFPKRKSALSKAPPFHIDR